VKFAVGGSGRAVVAVKALIRSLVLMFAFRTAYSRSMVAIRASAATAPSSIPVIAPPDRPLAVAVDKLSDCALLLAGAAVGASVDGDACGRSTTAGAVSTAIGAASGKVVSNGSKIIGCCMDGAAMGSSSTGRLAKGGAN
jgi:hypothetical protein